MSLHIGVIVAVLSCGGCRVKHDVDVKPTHHTLKIEPIHLTVDVNLRVQEELDRFYSDVGEGTPAQPAQGEKS